MEDLWTHDEDVRILKAKPLSRQTTSHISLLAAPPLQSLKPESFDLCLSGCTLVNPLFLQSVCVWSPQGSLLPYFTAVKGPSKFSQGEGTAWSPEEARCKLPRVFSLWSRHRICLIPPAELWWPVCSVCPGSSLGTQCLEFWGGRSFRHLCLAHSKFQTPRGKQKFSINYIIQAVQAQWPGLTSPWNGGNHSEIQVPSCRQAFLGMALPPPWSPWSAKPPSSLNVLD